MKLNCSLVLQFRVNISRKKSVVCTRATSCCLHIKPFFLPNDIISSAPSSFRPDSSSQRDTTSVVTACETEQTKQKSRINQGRYTLYIRKQSTQSEVYEYVFGAVQYCPQPFLSIGRKTIRKISVPTLIQYKIHHIAFTHAFMVTSRSPYGQLSHTNVVQHRGLDSNKLTPTHMSNPAISRPVSW